MGNRSQRSATKTPPVVVGMQQLLRLASVDEEFSHELVKRRTAIAPVVGVSLSDNEKAILDSIPESQLRETIRRIPPLPRTLPTLRATAAAAVVLLGGAALGGLNTSCKTSRPAQPEPLSSTSTIPTTSGRQECQPRQSGQTGSANPTASAAQAPEAKDGETKTVSNCKQRAAENPSLSEQERKAIEIACELEGLGVERLGGLTAH